MKIAHNITALNTFRQYTINNTNIAKSMEKLSSGYRINRAGDDAAGLAISEKMRAQIRGLNMASKNSQDAISLVQTAEGAVQETHNILQKMRELAVQSASDTNKTEVDREALDAVFTQLTNEINDIADKTSFNDKKLLTGDMAKFTASLTTSSAIITTGADANKGVSGAAFAGSQLATGTTTGAASVTFSGTTTGSMTVTIGGNVQGTTWTATNTISTSGSGKTLDLTIKDGAETYTLKSELGEIISFSTSSKFATGTENKLNGKALAFDIEAGTAATIQTGANAGDDLDIGVERMNATTIGLGYEGNWVNVATRDNAVSAIEAVDNAINTVSAQRAQLGAMQNRLEHKIANLDTSAENLQAAESRIRDIDMASEMSNFTKNNILAQAATAMLAQANQLPQGVLQLLR